jgi:hypothetical protein
MTLDTVSYYTISRDTTTIAVIFISPGTEKGVQCDRKNVRVEKEVTQMENRLGKNRKSPSNEGKYIEAYKAMNRQQKKLMVWA